MKKWLVSTVDPEKVKKIDSMSDLGRLLSEIAASRGLDTPEALTGFFNSSELADPFDLLDMDAAAETINEAVDSGSRIAVFGDYDCDGVCAAAILYDYLLNIGADVTAFIPEREGGYGLSFETVDKMHEAGAELIVTVDNGITAVAEAQRIKELGMKLVITDHHQPYDELPEAEAIVDPHRRGDFSEFKDICGAGVALKLCAALDGGDYTAVCEQYLDLAAIATVADVMPLVGENRIIVTKGLRLLRNTDNCGLLALCEKAGLKPDKISSQSLAFSLAPKINAAGRFGSAETAFRLLISETPEEAAELSETLLSLNGRRRSAEDGIMEEIIGKIDGDPELKYSRVLLVSGSGWHAGIIGIIAARLVEIYEKPAVVLSIKDGIATGSARSVEGFSIFRCFESARELLIKSGGHELAGGLTVAEENIPALREAIEEYARKNHPVMPKLTVKIDRLLDGSEVTYENAVSLQRLQPCGNGNPEPVFAVSGAVIKNIYPLSGGEHTKAILSCGGNSFPALFFRTKTDGFGFKPGDKVDIAANMQPEEFGGNRGASLIAIDFRPHGLKQDRFFAARDAYEKFRRGERLEKNILKLGLPTREEFVEIYRGMRLKGGSAAFERLYADYSARGFNAFKLRIIIDAFCDAGLMEFTLCGGRARLIPPKVRADITRSETLVKLTELLERE